MVFRRLPRITVLTTWHALKHTRAGRNEQLSKRKLTMKELERDQNSRLTVLEIAKRLDIGRFAVYQLLESGELLSIRLGRRWIVTRQAFEVWERTCGTPRSHGFGGKPEVGVVV